MVGFLCCEILEFSVNYFRLFIRGRFIIHLSNYTFKVRQVNQSWLVPSATHGVFTILPFKVKELYAEIGGVTRDKIVLDELPGYWVGEAHSRPLVVRAYLDLKCRACEKYLSKTLNNVLYYMCHVLPILQVLSLAAMINRT